MATKKRPLRAVAPDEKPPAKPRRRKAHDRITDALDGSSRDVLAAMRKALAKKLDAGEVASNAIASAYKELRELDRLIRAYDESEEPSRAADEGPRRSFDAAAL